MSSRKVLRQSRAEAGEIKAEVYGWKSHCMVKANPYTVANLFADIRRLHGVITPTLLVAEASNEDSILHDEFEWDDRQAATEYRLIQARHVLQSLTVRYRKPDGSLTPAVRYMVKMQRTAQPSAADDSDPAFDPGVYIPMRTVMESPEWSAHYVQQAWRDLSMWRARYREIADLAVVFGKVFEEIDELEASFEEGKAV